MSGRPILGWPDEKSMDELDLNYSTDAVRVVFTDTFSYHLKFFWGGRIPRMKEHRDHSGNFSIRKKKIFFKFCYYIISHKEAYVIADVYTDTGNINF